ncbi:hypothetical protein D3C87_1886690 [compost metagenome]
MGFRIADLKQRQRAFRQGCQFVGAKENLVDGRQGKRKEIRQRIVDRLKNLLQRRDGRADLVLFDQ